MNWDKAFYPLVEAVLEYGTITVDGHTFALEGKTDRYNNLMYYYDLIHGRLKCVTTGHDEGYMTTLSAEYRKKARKFLNTVLEKKGLPPPCPQCGGMMSPDTAGGGTTKWWCVCDKCFYCGPYAVGEQAAVKAMWKLLKEGEGR